MESAQDVYKRLESVILNQSTLADLNQRHFYMYGHSTIMGSYAPAWTIQDGYVRFNLTQSMVDTLVSKVSKNSPRPTFLTDNGDWGMRQKAIKREKFVFGQFYKSKVYQNTRAALYDCCVYGDGLVKVFRDGKDLLVERVNRLEMFVDDMECVNGMPRRMWQVRYIDRQTAQQVYGNKVTAEGVKASLPPFYLGGSIHDEFVRMVEYWKLPIMVKGKLVGGEHKLLCGETELLSEDWKRTTFPFARIQFIPNLVGYWSKGVAETITSYQIEVNRVLKRMSESVRLSAVPTVIYDYAAGVVKGHFSNDVGRMIGFDSRTGQPPQFMLPQAIGNDLSNYLQYVVQQAYGEVGLSQLSATSQKPAGLNSGKALREYNDLETERFASFAKGWEQFHMDIADLILEEAKAISDEYGDYTIMAPDKKGCEMISFKDADLDKEKYMIQVYPTSMLPKTPAGRLEYVQELIGAGMIEPQVGLSLLEFPDIEKYTKLQTAPQEDILATIDHMLDTDEYLPPETFQNLQFGIQMMNSAYLYYKNQKCPDEKLDLLLRWINDAMVLMQPPEEPAMTSSDLVAPDPASLGVDPDQAALEAQMAEESAMMQDTTGQLPVT